MKETNGTGSGLLNSLELSPLLLVFMSAIAAAALTCYFAVNQFSAMLDADSLSAHSYNVMRVTNNIELKMTQLEMSLRDYLLTDNDSYVDSWQQQVGDIRSEIAALSGLVKENPAQHQKVKQLSGLVTARLAILDKISGLKSDNALLTSDIANFLNNQSTFMDLTQKVDDITAIENAELKQRNSALVDDVYMTQKIIVDGMLASIAILLLSYYLQNRKAAGKDGRERNSNTKMQLVIDENDILKKSYDKLNVDMQEVKDRNEKISLLLEMSDIMLASSDMGEMSEIIAKYCSKVLNFSSGIFYIMHSSKNYLDASSCWGLPNVQTSNFFTDKCWALRMGHIYDANSVEMELICDHVKHRTGEEQFSYLCIPLRAQNDIYGLLYIEIAYYEGKENVLSNNDRLLVHAFTEVAALAMANIQLRASLMHQSLRDPLTSLYNRRYLFEFLSKQIYQCERMKSNMAVLMIDVDFFKKVNDIYGHDAGDIVLKELSQLFVNHVRPGDLACRYGGEEFILVLYNIDGENALTRADKLRQEASLLSIKYGTQTLGGVTISMGVSIYPYDGITTEMLIEKADTALYFAKNSGRNKVVLTSAINTTA